MTKPKLIQTLSLFALLAAGFANVVVAGETPTNSLPRVLLIGDSIRGGYGKGVQQLLAGKAEVLLNAGNAQYTGTGLKKIDEWLGDGKWDVIHFNWGLWDMYGWEYDKEDRSPAKYAERLEVLVTRMEKTGAKLIWATTTPACPEPEVSMRDRFKKPVQITPEIQKQYQDAALQVMKRHNVEIDDLYALMLPDLKKYQTGPDNVHFNGAGCTRLAQQVAASILLNGIGQHMPHKIPVSRGLMGNRFLTFTTVVRVRQIEMTRDVANGPDESSIHTPDEARLFRRTIEENWPGARITWAFSWLALKDQRPNYRALKELVVSYHKQYGDEITFIPGGYFANMYSTRDQVNRDLHEGLKMVSEMVGNGYRPRSVIAGFLAAENLRYLAESEDIHVCQGNIWSQHAVDNGDGDGSISYPYYPSRRHFLKPAQGEGDKIDCVNLDGWTCDFITARRAGGTGGFRSRSGVGPIETVLSRGTEIGLQEMLATTAAHFDEGFKLNRFAWVTCIWELCLVEGRKIYGYKGRNGMDGLAGWLREIRSRWPDARCITAGEFGLFWREQFQNNDKVDYRFVQRGTGFHGSEPNLEIRWFMNKDFRLALLRDWKTGRPEQAIDFTRYDLEAQEPADPAPGEHIRNWSLMNRLNQKGLRPQDKPISIRELNADEQALIKRRYPELIKDDTKK